MAVHKALLRSSYLSRRSRRGGTPGYSCHVPVLRSEAALEPTHRTNECKQSAVISNASTTGMLIKNNSSCQQCTLQN